MTIFKKIGIALFALCAIFVSCSNNPDAPTYYTVTFDSDFGTAVENQMVESGKTAAEPTAPTKDGYIFAGWYNGNSAFDFATAITADITLKAKWTETAVTPKTAGSISYATASVSKTTADAAFTNALTKTGDGTVSYASDNTAVATVNASTGEVTIKGAGTATITATVADFDTYTYATKTATYTLTITQAITYIGTKAPTTAKAVGDIVFSDGSATAYTSELTSEQKAAAVAVIFYAGNASDTLGAKTLGVGLQNATGSGNTLKWAISSAAGNSKNITAIQCTPSESGEKAATATFTGDLDGSDNWQALCEAVSDEGTSGNYPAWEWVNAYATGNSLAGSYASGWYLPTLAELSMLYREKATVNSALEKAGGTEIADTSYWSSSQHASKNAQAWSVMFGNGYLDYDYTKDGSISVCTVRAF